MGCGYRREVPLPPHRLPFEPVDLPKVLDDPERRNRLDLQRSGRSPRCSLAHLSKKNSWTPNHFLSSSRVAPSKRSFSASFATARPILLAVEVGLCSGRGQDRARRRLASSFFACMSTAPSERRCYSPSRRRQRHSLTGVQAKNIDALDEQSASPLTGTRRSTLSAGIAWRGPMTWPQSQSPLTWGSTVEQEFEPSPSGLTAPMI